MAGLPEVSARTLRGAYDRALEQVPDKLAQLGPDGRYTFAEAHERTLRLTGGLAGLGVGRGEPVAVLLDNSLDAVHALFGIGLGGMIEVPVNTAYKGGFLTHVLNDSGAGTLICEEHYVDRVAQVADALTALRTLVVAGNSMAAEGLRSRFRIVGFDELVAAEPAAPQAIEAGELLACMYTSGTTGRSKGVLISHAHAYTYASREDQARPVADDRILVTLPLFHLTGQWYGVYQALIHQARCVLEPAFSVRRFWPTIREHGITVTVMLGAMAELLQQAEPDPGDAANPLELAIMAPLASDVAGFRARFGIEVEAVYGMSEIGAVLNGPPETIVGGEAGFPRGRLRVAPGRRGGQRGPAGPDRRAAGAARRPADRAAWVSQPARGDRGDAGRWLGAHRRCVPHRRRGPLLFLRPDEGRAAPTGGERLQLRGGTGHQRAPGCLRKRCGDRARRAR
jgi:crotonobetaine/carnitine-CoA ligase